MRFHYLLFLPIMLSQIAQANSQDLFAGCGTYLVQGALERQNKTTKIRVFANTQSESILDLIGNQQDVWAKLNRTVKITGKITRPVFNFRGKIDVKKIELAVPDPIDPSHGDGFWLVNKLPCDTL